jgi:hypothetical protein
MTFSVTDILWSFLESSQCTNRGGLLAQSSCLQIKRTTAGDKEVKLSEHIIDADYFPTYFGLCNADAVCFCEIRTKFLNAK